MAKSQMQYANRAWRTETKALGWDTDWKRGKREWKEFCRHNSAITVADGGQTFDCQDAANEAVAEELTYWVD